MPVYQFGGGTISTVGECSDCPFVNHDTIFQWTDNFTWTHGKHTLRFGTDDRRMRYNQIGAVVARGRFTFNGTYTADPKANQPSRAEHAGRFSPRRHCHLRRTVGRADRRLPLAIRMNFYAMDSWKVTPKITINYGLRYEIEPPYSDKYDHIVNIAFNWDDTMFPSTFAPARAISMPVIRPRPSSCPPNIPYTRGMFGNRAYQTSYKDLAPRLGMA